MDFGPKRGARVQHFQSSHLDLSFAIFSSGTVLRQSVSKGAIEDKEYSKAPHFWVIRSHLCIKRSAAKLTQVNSLIAPGARCSITGKTLIQVA